MNHRFINHTGLWIMKFYQLIKVKFFNLTNCLRAFRSSNLNIKKKKSNFNLCLRLYRFFRRVYLNAFPEQTIHLKSECDLSSSFLVLKKRQKNIFDLKLGWFTFDNCKLFFFKSRTLTFDYLKVSENLAKKSSLARQLFFVGKFLKVKIFFGF